MTPKRIVITGGPSTGKTSLINALENDGHFCFHEVIRLMTQEAKENGDLSNLETNPIATVSDPMAFNQKIIYARLKDFLEAEKIEGAIAFYDRGIPDVLAYMNFFKQPLTDALTDVAKDNRYDAIFLLPIWKEIYEVDNQRFESYAEALKIHEHLRNTYTNLDYDIIDVPKESIENRTRFILNHSTKW